MTEERKLWSISRAFTLEQLGMDRFSDGISLDYDPERRIMTLRASVFGTKQDLELALWRFRYEIETMEKDVRKNA